MSRWASARLISVSATSRPSTSASVSSCCRAVIRSGPVSAYVRPRWPDSVSAARATDAMSAGWIVGRPTSA